MRCGLSGQQPCEGMSQPGMQSKERYQKNNVDEDRASRRGVRSPVFWVKGFMSRKEDFRLDEVVAALKLVQIGELPGPFSLEWMADRPDIQLGSVGIEVTDAIPKFDGQQRHFERELLNCKTVSDAQDKYKHNGGSDAIDATICPVQDTDYFFLTKSESRVPDDLVAEILERIIDKNKKFVSYEELHHFEDKRLFVIAEHEIFSSVPGLEINETPIFEQIKKSVFNKVYLDLFSELHIIDKSGAHNQTYHWDQYEKAEIGLEARRLLKTDDYEEKQAVLEKLKHKN